jgi:hypothetical protein
MHGPHLRRHRSKSRTLLFLAFCAVLAAGATFAAVASSATGPNAQLVSQNRVYGGGQFTNSFDGSIRNFAIDAHANGAAAYGDIEYGGTVHAGHEQVTCLKVVGNQATLGAVITQADRPAIIGWFVLQVYQDNGGLFSGTPDAATLQVQGPGTGVANGWTAGFPYVCPSPDTTMSFFGLSYMPLSGGDVVVQDATAN